MRIKPSRMRVGEAIAWSIYVAWVLLAEISE
jgi:hypothetical protein